jgi:hypothetical protein
MKPWGILYAGSLLVFLKFIDSFVCQRGYADSQNLAGTDSGTEV